MRLQARNNHSVAITRADTLKLPLLAVLALLLIVAAIKPASAATWGIDTPFNLTNTGNGVEITAGDIEDNGNVYSFTEDGLGITLSAWTDDGTGNFQASEARIQAGGMGVCNDAEDGALFGFFPYNCGTFLDFNQTNRQLDNSNGRDWILLVFTEPVLLQNIDLTPLGTRDMDLTFRAGTINTSDLSSVSYDDLDSLGFRGRNNRFLDTPQNALLTYDLTDSGSANALLIGGLLEDADDAFLISEITVQAVPVPASIWLLGSAVIGLAGLRRKSRG